jgi:hypothetical protein
LGRGQKISVSLYGYSLATYDKDDVFGQGTSPGFIPYLGATTVQADVQSGEN